MVLRVYNSLNGRFWCFASQKLYGANNCVGCSVDGCGNLLIHYEYIYWDIKRIPRDEWWLRRWWQTFKVLRSPQRIEPRYGDQLSHESWLWRILRLQVEQWLEYRSKHWTRLWAPWPTSSRGSENAIHKVFVQHFFIPLPSIFFTKEFKWAALTCIL